MSIREYRDDVPAADAAEQHLPADPAASDVDPSPASEMPADADPADVLDQRVDAGPDDEDQPRFT